VSYSPNTKYTNHATIDHHHTSSIFDDSNELCVDAEGGILSGSVGNLSKFIKPSSSNQPINHHHLRKQSTTSSSSSGSSTSLASSEYINNNNSNINSNANDAKSNNSSTEFIDFDEIADNPDSLLLSFRCPLSDEKEVEWKTLLVNGVLYVDVPTSILPDGSRDSFVSLLEFAEDKLECEKVYVCFKRNRADRNALMRVFMFLGFAVVPPDCKEVPQNDEIMSMVYNIE